MAAIILLNHISITMSNQKNKYDIWIYDFNHKECNKTLLFVLNVTIQDGFQDGQYYFTKS